MKALLKSGIERGRRIGARAFPALVVAGSAIAFWKRGEARRLLAVNSLFSPARITANFSNMDKLFHTRPMSRGDGPPTPLPAGEPATLPPATAPWIGARNITALLALKDGRIVFERYYQGTGPDDLRISWSVAKSWLSALFGIVLEEGAIDSIDDPVVKYAPRLEGSAYESATIRNVLNMASGVKFNEDYLDYHSDINRMGRVLALGGSMDAFAAGLKEKIARPGEFWQYVSIDTHVIGMVIRGATGRDIPELMAEKLIRPMGLERAPCYLTDGEGTAFVLGGLNMTSRDYARFGLMFLQDGRLAGRRIVPPGWVRASTEATAPTLPGEERYGYQWWLPADAREGEFFARGIYGQHIYINRPLGAVIVTNAADRDFREEGVAEENIAMFRAIAEAL